MGLWKRIFSWLNTRVYNYLSSWIHRSRVLGGVLASQFSILNYAWLKVCIGVVYWRSWATLIKLVRVLNWDIRIGSLVIVRQVNNDIRFLLFLRSISRSWSLLRSWSGFPRRSRRDCKFIYVNICPTYWWCGSYCILHPLYCILWCSLAI